ncbi:MAG TPA: Tm-1-like ATP-binding domain-containing protein [Candidatus Limnocylindrales bacterium]|nr:Tm-1-like ATP-binding domain-containing protein [Candidatus Limnocylindrales bacterium]
MATVVLLGTLDTKGAEYEYLRERVRAAGCDVILVDAGVMAAPPAADISSDEVARAGGADRAALAAAADRGPAVAAMTRGAVAVVQRLHGEGRLDAIVGLGGSGGSAIISAAMQALPVGVPKLLVSTMASGDTRPYIGTADIAMMYSVVDIAGINEISERILSNAAAAAAGMALAAAEFVQAGGAKPLVGATMFGVTTPCVTVAREHLEERGYEVLVFHATGAGGRSMEALMKGGFITASLDITTTELADELVGGVLSAGPDRLEMASALGIPQVVSVGALDMVNFGPLDTVPAQFKDRNLYVHNPTVTLMRTTEGECAELGRIIARKLNAAKGPLTVFIPLRGVSMIDVPGKPFHEPDADAALFRELKGGLRPDVEVVEMDTDINDPAFARAMAERLDAHYRAWAPRHVTATQGGRS